MERKIKALVKELVSKHDFHIAYSRKGYQELVRCNDFVAILEYEDKPTRIIAGPCTSTCPGTFWAEGEAFDKNDIVNRIMRRLGDVK